MQEPSIELRNDKFYGDKEWKRRTRESLETHAHKRPRTPRVSAGLIAASDRLIKDDQVLARWMQVARQIMAVEMESAGVYLAARGRGSRCKAYPAMAIRGISDVVGFKRDEAWTRYACIFNSHSYRMAGDGFQGVTITEDQMQVVLAAWWTSHNTYISGNVIAFLAWTETAVDPRGIQPLLEELGNFGG